LLTIFQFAQKLSNISHFARFGYSLDDSFLTAFHPLPNSSRTKSEPAQKKSTSNLREGVAQAFSRHQLALNDKLTPMFTDGAHLDQTIKQFGPQMVNEFKWHDKHLGQIFHKKYSNTEPYVFANQLP
jgi:hypothetical protein